MNGQLEAFRQQVLEHRLKLPVGGPARQLRREIETRTLQPVRTGEIVAMDVIGVRHHPIERAVLAREGAQIVVFGPPF